MKTHTPGPWTISESRQPNGWEILGPLCQPVAIEPWHGDASHAQYRDIYEANARLIAAAPDLLSAMPTVPHPGGKLIKVVAHYADGSTQTIDGEVVTAAIAKATEAK